MPFACTAVIDRLRVYVTLFYYYYFVYERRTTTISKPEQKTGFRTICIFCFATDRRSCFPASYMHDIARIGDGVCIGLTRCSSKMLTYAVISVSRVNWTLLMMHNHFNWNLTWSIYQSQSFVSWNMHYNLKQRQKWTPFFVLIFFFLWWCRLLQVSRCIASARHQNAHAFHVNTQTHTHTKCRPQFSKIRRIPNAFEYLVGIFAISPPCGAVQSVPNY